MVTDSHLQPLEANPILFLADDDCDDCDIFTDAIKAIAPQVELTCVSTCEKLLDNLGAATLLPDLIFLDLNIRAMGGLRCLYHIKQQPQYAHIPVIIYSTSNHPADITAAFKGGAMRYFCKSAQFEHLTSSLRYLIANYANGVLYASTENFLIAEKETVRPWPT